MNDDKLFRLILYYYEFFWVFELSGSKLEKRLEAKLEDRDFGLVDPLEILEFYVEHLAMVDKPLGWSIKQYLNTIISLRARDQELPDKARN